MKTVGNFDITGSIIQSGSDGNQFLGDVAIANSKIFKGGSTKFGDDVTDTHQFTGSIIIKDSIKNVSGDSITTGSFVEQAGNGLDSYDGINIAASNGRSVIISVDGSNILTAYKDFFGDTTLELLATNVYDDAGTTFSSTNRLKNDISDFSASYVDSFDQLRPVYFEWNSNDAPDFGLIAEELNTIYPEFVVKNGGGDITGYRPGAITALLIKTVQDLRQRVADLESGAGA